MSLKDQVADKAKEIRTDGYAMSIGEVITLCNEKDIDIHPEFQRIFRWKPSQKSRLIESILLGIPIPPIFVSQRADGVWDVIDGVQRLSTILEFTGNYADESGNRKPGFILEAGEYLSDMAGLSWDVAADVKQSTLESLDSSPELEGVFDDVLRRDFRRAKLEFRIITKGSDASAKYDLFQRLNSGSVLSPQEARNCLMVMINSEMFYAVQRLASEGSFAASVQLSERQAEQAYSQELVLRFFAQLDYEGGVTELRLEFGEYLTKWMRAVAGGDGISDESKDIFRRTFRLLVEALDDDIFRRWDGSRHTGPFSISSFEFITTGVAHHLERWERAQTGELDERIRGIWANDEFRSWSGTGVSPRRRVPRMINNSRKYFE